MRSHLDNLAAILAVLAVLVTLLTLVTLVIRTVTLLTLVILAVALLFTLFILTLRVLLTLVAVLAVINHNQVQDLPDTAVQQKLARVRCFLTGSDCLVAAKGSAVHRDVLAGLQDYTAANQQQNQACIVTV